MGAIAEALVAYAQPLLDQTDGSEEQLNKAFAISQLCYNLAVMPEDRREEMLVEWQQSLEMDDREFDDFRHSVIDPMIRRHEDMFPRMRRQGSTDFSPSRPSPPTRPKTTGPAKGDPRIDRYAPCPCNSGRKYKFCCGKKRR